MDGRILGFGKKGGGGGEKVCGKTLLNNNRG